MVTARFVGGAPLLPTGLRKARETEIQTFEPGAAEILGRVVSAFCCNEK
jgi:hypothetical protein